MTRVRVDPALQPFTLERCPMILGLRQPIGHGVEHCRVHAQPAMAAMNFDIVGRAAFRLPTILPSDDPVLARVDGGGRNGRRRRTLLELALGMRVVDLLTRECFLEPRDIGNPRATAKGQA